MNNNISILVVDDSRLMRDMVSYALETAGYEDITLAEDGVDALEKADTKEFDLIVTDINMPNMNGFELCEELRKKEIYPLTPIVVLTTEASTKMKERGKKAGASAWLIKPFVPEELLYVIEKLLAKK